MRSAFGGLLLAACAFVLIWPTIHDGVTESHLWAALALGIVGGTLLDPAAFKEFLPRLFERNRSNR